MIRARKLVIVTRKTPLEELVERFNTRDQARFYVEHMGGTFSPYEQTHATYREAIDRLKSSLPRSTPTQWIDRAFLPTFTFDRDNVVVVLGQDGLVVNTAKYLNGQPLVGVNPDPRTIDGVLLPFSVESSADAIDRALSRRDTCDQITMAQATLNDGQCLLAVNDLFIGPKTHVSARYRIRHGGQEELQSSSGIIVSTGAGSTGWLRSILTGAIGIVERRNWMPSNQSARDQYRFDREARLLVFSVREPFVSKTSSAECVYGRIDPNEPLEIESLMPQNGVIFSDGIEEDYLRFNSGCIARIGVAARTLRLVVPDGPRRTRWRTGEPDTLEG